MKKIHMVVMLPTNKMEGAFSEGGETGLHDKLEFGINQHLYLVSDEEIKEGDWCISGDTLWQFGKVYNTKGWSKVIATTDKVLNLLSDNGRIGYKVLPKIPESFLKQYVEADGKIDEVEVMYKEFGERKGLPFLTDSNEVIISPIEEKMYSSKDVDKIIHRYREYGLKFGIEDINLTNKWISNL